MSLPNVAAECRLVHQASYGEVGQQEAVELLPHQFWSFATNYDTRAAKMRFEFIKDSFDSPAARVERGQFLGRSF